MTDQLEVKRLIEAERSFEPRLPIAAYGPILELAFPLEGVAVDVEHGLAATPDGFLTLLQNNGWVYAIDVHTWSSTIAMLAASHDHTRARVCFFTLEPGVITNVVPS